VDDLLTRKQALISWLSIDSGALHVLAAMLVLFAAAALWRRTIFSWPAWSTVLAVELLNEAATGYGDGVLESWELAGSIEQVALGMTLPTLLLVMRRAAPRLFLRDLSRPRALSPHMDAPAAAPEILDAEFEDLQPRLDMLR